MEKVSMFIMAVCLLLQFYDVSSSAEGNNICFVILLLIFILYKLTHLMSWPGFDPRAGILTAPKTSSLTAKLGLLQDD